MLNMVRLIMILAVVVVIGAIVALIVGLVSRNKEKSTIPPATENSCFDGNFWQRLGWIIVARFLTVITLGLAYPAAVCMLLRWECKHTVINGRRLKFTGKGGQLFGKYILWWLLTVVTFGVFGIWLGLNMKKWTVKHTVYADDNTGTVSRFTAGVGGYLGIRLLAYLLTVCTFGIGAAWGKRMILNWEADHTYISGTHLDFTGRGGQLFGKYLLWGLLTVITFSIFSLFIPIKFLKWQYKHTGATPVEEVPAESKTSGGAIVAAVGLGLAVLLIVGTVIALFFPRFSIPLRPSVDRGQNVPVGNYEQLPEETSDTPIEPEQTEEDTTVHMDSGSLIGSWIGCSKAPYESSDPAGFYATAMSCLHWEIAADGTFTSYIMGYGDHGSGFMEYYNPVKHIGNWELSGNTLTIRYQLIDYPAEEPDKPTDEVESYTVHFEDGMLIIDGHRDCSAMLKDATADDVYAYVTGGKDTQANGLSGIWIVIGTPELNEYPDTAHTHWADGGYFTFYDDGSFELECIQFAKHIQQSWYHVGGGEDSFAGTYEYDGVTLTLHYTTTYEIYWDGNMEAACPVDMDVTEQMQVWLNPDGMTAEVSESPRFGSLSIFQKACTEIPIDDILTILKEQY